MLGVLLQGRMTLLLFLANLWEHQSCSLCLWMMCPAVKEHNRHFFFLFLLQYPKSMKLLPSLQTFFFLGTSSLLLHMMGWVHIAKLLCLQWLGCPPFESMFSWPLGFLRQKGSTRVWWVLLGYLLPLKVWNSQTQDCPLHLAFPKLKGHSDRRNRF